MQKPQRTQYDMLLAVENHFDDNKKAWESNIPISTVKARLSQKLDEIATEVSFQIKNYTGITRDKADARKDLEHKGFVISAALSGYASLNPEKKDMYKRVYFTKTQFLQFRESELIGVISNLHEEAFSELAHLGPYGITPTTLSELHQANNTFRTIMKKPSTAISNRHSATEKIKVLLPEVLTMVETQMDNLIVALTGSQPNFVAVYSKLRSLRNIRTTTLALTIKTIDANTNEPVSNAKLEIASKRIRRVSGKNGVNRIQHLSAGLHQLKINHPNYAPQNIAFTIVQGETTELVIALQNPKQTD